MAESFLQDPPEGVEVVSNVDDYTRRTGVHGERTSTISREAKQIIDRLTYIAGVPRLLPSIPDSDIIHTLGGLVPLCPKPWITSISMPSTFFGLHDDWHESKRRQWVLGKILRSHDCKCVTSFSQSTIDGLKETFKPAIWRAIESKVQLLYPAINPGRFCTRQRRENGPFRILFVGNHFFDKGGRELHRAVSRLAKRFDVRLDLVTDAPPHHREALRAYMGAHQEEWVNWHVPGLTRKELRDKLYPAADVFVMCSYMEVFGYVFLEAMASGLPIIGAKVYAQREIISEGVNGYLIDVPSSPYEGEPQTRTPRSSERYRRVILDETKFDNVVDQLVDRLTILIEDDRTRRSMSEASLKMTTEGKFSIRSKNKTLIEIYQNALSK